MYKWLKFLISYINIRLEYFIFIYYRMIQYALVLQKLVLLDLVHKNLLVHFAPWLGRLRSIWKCIFEFILEKNHLVVHIVMQHLAKKEIVKLILKNIIGNTMLNYVSKKLCVEKYYFKSYLKLQYKPEPGSKKVWNALPSFCEWKYLIWIIWI